MKNFLLCKQISGRVDGACATEIVFDSVLVQSLNQRLEKLVFIAFLLHVQH